MSPFRLLVTGGRHYDDSYTVTRLLDRAMERHASRGLVIVHGGATGLDELAGRWVAWRKAEGRPVSAEVHPADWDVEGKSAGPSRNARMVRRGADACMSFPGGSGTADCTQRAREAGIRVGTVDVRGVLTWGRG